MRVKVSDYIADFFAENGIRTIFTVVGGGAMHMNHSFGHHPSIKCIYNHHEQASSIAAEGYYRVNNEMAGLCVTSGPGAINALNGVVGAYQDSIPMIVVSGQTKTTLTVKSSGLHLRTLGNQEFDIVSCLENVCKYSEMIMDASKIRYCLEKAFYLAKSGRPGPCWLDIPVDIQGSYIETENLVGYEKETAEIDEEESVSAKIEILFENLKSAKRPVIYAGNGIRIAGAEDVLITLAKKCNVPVVTCWDSIDLIETDNPLYVGRAGIMGDRAGNFAVQNSDLLIAIGNRLNVYQVGYQYETWARAAYKVMVDIDPLELIKPTINIDLKICYDAKRFMEMLLEVDNLDMKVNNDKDNLRNEWLTICNQWKKKYPVVSEKQNNQKDLVNVYTFMDRFSLAIPNNTVTVVANGSASVVGSAAYNIKKGNRFIMNCGLSSMGYDLPASIGVATAIRQMSKECDYNKKVVCIAGDGSIQMNIQELQTIVTNKLPVKIVVINNAGYHQIRLTQTNVFDRQFVGMGEESGDLEFPEFERLAYAYGIPYISCKNNSEIYEKTNELMNSDGYALMEVFCDTEQIFEPKSATKKRDDGTLFSPPLEDLSPFLSREELESNMFISTIGDN